MTDWLLLHGFAGGSESWDEVRQLANLDSARAPRLAGHELDGEPVAPGDDFEDEVHRLADRCGERVAVCGYSLGGRLALGLACEHPGRVERLVLIGANPGLQEADARDERWRVDERWASLLEERGSEEFFERWLEQPLFASQRRLGAERLALQDAVRRRLRARGLARSMRQLSLAHMPSYWGRLSSIHVPVDLVVGGEDVKFRGLAEAMAESLPTARLRIVEGVGHNVVLEAPEVIAEILKEGAA